VGFAPLLVVAVVEADMLVLVPGGLWEDMDAARFWAVPGVIAALPNTEWRWSQPPNWTAET
jgi:hypothetical protein